jgi:PEP-CTERM motif
VVPVFAFLNLHFVPEPGTLVLLGAGIAGLVSYGRTRNRKA